MSDATKLRPQGSDWTRLLTDPDLVSHLGKLLKTYREVPPEQREAALLRAMREIKDAAAAARVIEKDPLFVTEAERSAKFHHPEVAKETPPFAADLFTPQVGQDRRRYGRIKCHVAVEIHIEGVKEPVWGNLANVGRGGCMVETVGVVPMGKALEIGLWVTSDKIWVKGVILSGVATRSAQFGIRVQFSEAELAQKEHLREFLKFVENAASKSQDGHNYVEQLKK